jgi:hypothetical protein
MSGANCRKKPHSFQHFMNFSFSSASLLVLVVAIAISACKKEAGLNTGLIGSWRLTSRQCECLPAPTPNETVSFTATGFSFYKNGQFYGNGTYADTTATLCGSSTPVPALRLTYSTLKLYPPTAGVTVTGNTLVLDYGGPCDAPVDTYVRLP